MENNWILNYPKNYKLRPINLLDIKLIQLSHASRTYELYFTYKK